MDFFKHKLVIVHCAAWFAKCEKTIAGFQAIEYYVGAIDERGEIQIVRGAATDKLTEERAMVAEHNRRIDEYGDASAEAAREAARKAVLDGGIEAARKKAALNRGGPSALFNSQPGATP